MYIVRQHNFRYVTSSCILNVSTFFFLKITKMAPSRKYFFKKSFVKKVFLSQRVGIHRYQLCFYFLSAFILLYIQVTLKILVVIYGQFTKGKGVFLFRTPPQIAKTKIKIKFLALIDKFQSWILSSVCYPLMINYIGSEVSMVCLRPS